MKHFTQLSEEELSYIVNAAKDAMAGAAKRLGMGGLSALGSHNLYRAVEDAIYIEYRIAQKNRGKIGNKPSRKLYMKFILEGNEEEVEKMEEQAAQAGGFKNDILL